MNAWNGRAPRAALFLVAAVLGLTPPLSAARRPPDALLPSPYVEPLSGRHLTRSATEVPAPSVVRRPTAAPSDPGRSHARTRPRGVPDGVYTALAVAASVLTLGIGVRVARGASVGPW